MWLSQVGDSWHCSRPHLSQVLAASHHHSCQCCPLNSNHYFCPYHNILTMFMLRHPVLENILCFFAGFVVVITMGTGSKQYNPQLFWSSPCFNVQPLTTTLGFLGRQQGSETAFSFPSSTSPTTSGTFLSFGFLRYPLFNPWKLLIQFYFQGPEQWECCGRQVEDARPHLLPYHQLSRTQKPLLTKC